MSEGLRRRERELAGTSTNQERDLMTKRSTIDLTDWVTHFVHNAGSVEESSLDYEYAYESNEEVEDRFDLWNFSDQDYGLSYDASAFEVLLKILHDGHIRTGWSFRKGNPTIYGPQSACCFTEMPLYALMDYARIRTPDTVRTYGISVRKREFFEAGGRPVIYGLTGKHRVTQQNQAYRRLDDACGISLREQYRYVAMKLDSSTQIEPIDWSHEREWRWCDSNRACSCPGLPVWLKNEPTEFREVIITVSTKKEAEIVLDKLKQMSDARFNVRTGDEYCLDALYRTRVISLDALVDQGLNTTGTLRLEDVPSVQLLRPHVPVTSTALTERVQVALAAASEAARSATQGFNNLGDVFGFAILVIENPQHAVTQTLLEMGVLEVSSGIGYKFKDIVSQACTTHMLGEQELAAYAAAETLQQHFPDCLFTVRTFWD